MQGGPHMPDVKHKQETEAISSVTDDAANERKARLAIQLRANLRRRKARASKLAEAKERSSFMVKDEG
ncbi:hypothetical protein SAMN07250955_104252 [Arboricoccus pini]|uniref:Uncharacterized protein n=1 Tax=Arboricoccus pini TaxID=1963835 RepID=A0A212R086_9PROT|nr:hypothetical protein [Arboricoccus pini]SNB65384.1 hypothetical protein SAMN07250955_104252 [Arboricoccus pini]